MRRLIELGGYKQNHAFPDYGGRAATVSPSMTKDERDRALQTHLEMTRLAMGVISTFSAVEYLQDLLVVRLAIGSEVAPVNTLFSALRAEGPKKSARDAMVKKYLVDKDDRERLDILDEWTQDAREDRNIVAHSLWFAVAGHPEYLLFVNPRDMTRDNVMRKSFVATTPPDPETGLVGPIPEGEALDQAFVAEKKDLEDWTERNFTIHRAWGTFLMVAEQPQRLEQTVLLRGLLDGQLGRSPTGIQVRSRQAAPRPLYGWHL